MHALVQKALSWVWGHGSAVLTVQFSEGATGWRNVGCTTLQAAVFMWFNAKATYKVSELAELMGFTAANMPTFNAVIGSMCNVRPLNPLKKTPRQAKIAPDDVLEIDSEFKHKQRVRGGAGPLCCCCRSD